jgi:CheY-like chemotaxis protein
MSPEAALILLVDDDPDFLDLNRRVLEARGFRVAVASDPEEALERMAHERPALVVTDLMMQRLDSGFSLAGRIKADPRFAAVPVIIVTAVASRLGLDFHPRLPDELAAMHAEAFFEKPVPPDRLLATVTELLRAATSSPAPATGEGQGKRCKESRP